MEYSLSARDILKYTGGKTKIILYNQLYKYKTIDDLLYPYDNVFLLYLTTLNSGHWTFVFRNSSKNIEVFDSYGMFIDMELDAVDISFLMNNKMEKPYLSLLLSKYPREIEYNDHQFQAFKRGVNTCGRWCLLRWKERKVSCEEFEKKYRKLTDKELVKLVKMPRE